MSQRVLLFVNCLVDQLFPEVGLATATVLERLGYETEFREEQTCCGHAGLHLAAIPGRVSTRLAERARHYGTRCRHEWRHGTQECVRHQAKETTRPPVPRG